MPPRAVGQPNEVLMSLPPILTPAEKAEVAAVQFNMGELLNGTKEKPAAAKKPEMPSGLTEEQIKLAEAFNEAMGLNLNTQPKTAQVAPANAKKRPPVEKPAEAPPAEPVKLEKFTGKSLPADTTAHAPKKSKGGETYRTYAGLGNAPKGDNN